MNVLFLNMACGSPVSELHASISQMHHIDRIVILPNNQNYSHANQTGSILARIYRTKIEELIVDFFPEAIVTEMKFDFERLNIDNDTDHKLKISALSSINSHIRIHCESELPAHWKKTFNELVELSRNIYCWFSHFCEINQKLRLFCFNGRFCEDFAAIEACKVTNKNYSVYDLKDHDSNTFYLFNDRSLHSFQENCRRAKYFFSENTALARNNATDFMRNKISGIKTYEKSYTSHQTESYKSKSGPIISIFPSSDDEYRFLGEDWNGLIVNQVIEIKNLIKRVQQQFEFDKIVIKMHPNMAFLPKATLQRYYELENSYCFVDVIPANSKINTYDLLDKSEIVVVFCSTVGVEANFLRKRVIGIAGSPYHDLPVLNKVNSGIEAAEMILEGKVKLKSKLASIIWMNYLWKYSDVNPHIVEMNGRNVFSNQILKNKGYLRLLVIPSRLNIIFRQSMSGIFPSFDRLTKFIKSLVNH